MNSASLKNKSLIILGGAGARASALFHCRFVEKWLQTNPCGNDSDFPTILHWSKPLKGLGPLGVSSLAALEETLLAELAQIRPCMGEGDSVVLSVPCSSVTFALNKLSPQLDFPKVITPWSAYFKDFQEAHWPFAASKTERPLVLCSASTVSALQNAHFGLMEFPEKPIQQRVNHLIENTIGEPDLRPLAASLNELVSMYCERPVVLACTELSVLNSISPNPTAVDAMDCLVASTVSELLS